MNWIYSLSALLLFISYACSLSLRAEEEIMLPHAALSENECDPSSIPVMNNFDMKQFSGAWFVLAKSASGYIDVNDGMWKILTTNTSTSFLFSGRDTNGHCIRPIKGKIHQSDQPPGTLHLHYQTYSTHVEETIRVLFTDYSTIAVIYLCMHHVHREKEVCHAAGLMGAIWTRRPHVDLSVYENALRYLEMACVHRSVLILRNQVGPCKVDDLGFRIDDFPAPDFCYQPKDLGYCRGNIQRYYYDPRERTCNIFSYSGCGGNKNNFMSIPECQEKCLSASLKEPICMSIAKCAIHCSPCCTENRNGCVECNCELVVEDDFLNCMKSPAYCQPECAVEEFYHGCYVCSCHEVNEPFIPEEPPECLEVQVIGDCSNQIERYYYNALTMNCEKFIYSGCGGNNNNFETVTECMQKCKVESIKKADVMLDNDDEGDSATMIKNNGWIIASFILLFTIMIHD